MRDVVSAEHLRNGVSLQGEKETYLHRIAFGMLREASLDPASTKALILETAESKWAGSQRAS